MSGSANLLPKIMPISFCGVYLAFEVFQDIWNFNKVCWNATLPCPSFPCFFGIPCFFPCEDFLVFLSIFPFFSRDFRGSAGIKNPCFFGGFPRRFPRKQEKEGQGVLSLNGLKLYNFVSRSDPVLDADHSFLFGAYLVLHGCTSFLGPATTQNRVVKFDGEICGGVFGGKCF